MWGSIAMQDKLIGFWSFPIFFRVLHQTGNKLFTLNQAFIKKHLEKPSSKTYFPVGTRAKYHLWSNKKILNQYA